MHTINFDYAMSIIKDGKTEEIEDFMKGLPQTIQSVQIMYAMREKALELCKNGEIVMERMKLFFTRDNTLETFKPVAMPEGLYLKFSHLEDAVAGIFCFEEIKKDTILGPYMGVDVYDNNEENDRGFSWEIYMNNQYHHCINGEEAGKANWMRYVNRIDQTDLQNLEAFQKGFKVYFRAVRDIPPCTELLVWYSLNYNQELFQCDLYKEKPHKCDICQKAFKQAGNLVTHIRTHTGEKPYKCEMCSSSFSRTGHLIRHKRIHTGYKPFKCDICDKTFNDKHHMHEHRRIHTGETPYKCGACHRRFTHIVTYHSHNCKENRDKIKYCDYCGKKFVNLGSLKKHLVIHLLDYPFQCINCDKMFATSCLMDEHECSEDVEKSYKCDICGLDFGDFTALKVHKCIRDEEEEQEALDTKVEGMKERLLQKEESTMQELLDKYRGKKLWNVGKTYKIHKQINNLHSNNHLPNRFKNKRYVCYFCNYASAKNADFKNHLRIHTGEKPFECKVCDSRFARHTHLIRHNRLHTGEKPYKCDFCGRSFNENYHLQEHKRTHTGEKPYKCTLCQKRFAARSSWKSHKCAYAVDSENDVSYLQIMTAKESTLKLSKDSNLILSVEKKKDYEQNYQCDLCGFFTDKKSRFERHSKREHIEQKSIEFDSSRKFSLKIKKYQCHLCSFFTDNNPRFEIHLNRNHNEEIF